MATRDKNKYFIFSPDIRYVAGAHLGAIYDLESGNVYSLDRNGRMIIEQLLKGIGFRNIPAALSNGIGIQEVASFLADLEQLDVGYIAAAPPDRFYQQTKVPENARIRKLWLELTPRCNFRCIHCYANSAMVSQKKDSSLSLQQWKDVIRAAARYDPPWIQFIGGEPLLCGKAFLQELLEQTHVAGIEGIEVFTNAYLLDQKWVDILYANKASIAFSIYSKKAETHDRITGIPGSHKKLLHHIDMLIRNNIPVRPGFILMQENENEEAETREWLQQSFGMHVASPDIIRCTPESRCSQGVHFSRALWQRKLRTDAHFTKVTGEHFYHHQSGHPCLFGSLCIHHDGEAYPCVMDRNRRLGNVKDGSLAEIITSKTTENVWRQSMDKIVSCSDCEFRFACCDCRPEAAGIDALLSSREYPDFSVKNPCCLYDPYTGVWNEPDPLLDALTKISFKAGQRDR